MKSLSNLFSVQKISLASETQPKNLATQHRSKGRKRCLGPLSLTKIKKPPQNHFLKLKSSLKIAFARRAKLY